MEMSLHRTDTAAIELLCRGRLGLWCVRCGGRVAYVCHAFAHLMIESNVGRGVSGEAIHVAVVHAEGGGDENRVVNFEIGRAGFAG